MRRVFLAIICLSLGSVFSAVAQDIQPAQPVMVRVITMFPAPYLIIQANQVAVVVTEKRRIVQALVAIMVGKTVHIANNR